MSWTDRLIGLAFGCVAGVIALLLAYGISTFASTTYQVLWIGVGQGLFIGFCIWGWHGGAYALGRVVRWVQKKS